MRIVHLNENLPDTAKSVLSCGENEIWVTDAALAPTGLHVLDVVRSLFFSQTHKKIVQSGDEDFLQFNIVRITVKCHLETGVDYTMYYLDNAFEDDVSKWHFAK